MAVVRGKTRNADHPRSEYLPEVIGIPFLNRAKLRWIGSVVAGIYGELGAFVWDERNCIRAAAGLCVAGSGRVTMAVKTTLIGDGTKMSSRTTFDVTPETFGRGNLHDDDSVQR